MNEVIASVVTLLVAVIPAYLVFRRQRANDKTINAAQADKLRAEAEDIRQAAAGKERQRLTAEIERLDTQIEELRAEYEVRIVHLEQEVAHWRERSDKLEQNNRALTTELSRKLDLARVEMEA